MDNLRAWLPNFAAVPTSQEKLVLAGGATIVSVAAAYLIFRGKIKKHEILMTVPTVDCSVERTFVTANGAYTHGGAMGAAVPLLRSPEWRKLVELYTPFTAARLAVLGETVAPSSAMLVLENSPVVAAYATLRNRDKGHAFEPRFKPDLPNKRLLPERMVSPVVMEWDVYLPPTAPTTTANSSSLSGRELTDRTIVQHGTLMQIVQERLFGWSMHSEVRQLSGDINVPRWLFCYFAAMKRARQTFHRAPATAAAGAKQGASSSPAGKGGKAPLLSVFLDVKSTTATPESLASLVRTLNDEYGVHVWAVGSFVYRQLQGIDKVQQRVLCPITDETDSSVESECDQAMGFLASKLGEEELAVPNSQLSREDYQQAKAKASASCAAGAAAYITLPPPLPFYLSSSVAKIQSTVEDAERRRAKSAASTAFEAGTVEMALQPADASLIPSRDALVVFNGGGLLRREVPAVLRRALYSHLSITQANKEEEALDLERYLRDVLLAVRSSSSDPTANVALSNAVIDAAASSWAAEQRASGESFQAVAVRMLWKGPAPLIALPLLYDVEAVAYLDHLRRSRGYEFGYYTDEQKLEPLASSLLAAIAEYRGDLFGLGYNNGYNNGECALAKSHRVEGAAATSSARDKVPFMNGLVVPWWLQRAIPTEVRPVLEGGRRYSEVYPITGAATH